MPVMGVEAGNQDGLWTSNPSVRLPRMMGGVAHTDPLPPEILIAGNPAVSLLKGADLFLLLLFIYLGVGSAETQFESQGTKGYSVQIPLPIKQLLSDWGALCL